MARLGDDTTPGSGFWFDTSGNKQFWTTNQWIMPAGGGIATDINVFCAGDGGAVTGQLVIWDSGANIFWQSGNMTIPAGSRSVHGQGWVHASIPNVYIPGGNYEVGFWSSGAVVWTFESNGGVSARSGLGAGPSNNTGSDEYGGAGFGRLGAYVEYTPGSIARVRRSSAWTGGIPVQERRSSAWTGGGPLVQERRGGTWVPVT